MLAFCLIWIRVPSAEIYKRLNIEYDKAMYTNSAKNIQNNKEATNTRRSWTILSRLSIFHRLYIEQQIPKPTVDNKRKMFYSLGKKKRHTVKRNLELSAEEKEYNKSHSIKRIVIESIPSSVDWKKYRIMSDVFRNRLRKYNIISDVVAGCFVAWFPFSKYI